MKKKVIVSILSIGLVICLSLLALKKFYSHEMWQNAAIMNLEELNQATNEKKE